MQRDPRAEPGAERAQVAQASVRFLLFFSLLFFPLALVVRAQAPVAAEQSAAANSSPPPKETSDSPETAQDDSTSSAEPVDEDESTPFDERPLIIDTEVKKDLEQRLQSLDAAGLDEDKKQQAVELLQEAILSYDAARQQLESAARFESESAAVPAETAKYSQKATAPLKPLANVEGEVLAQIEKRIVTIEASVAECRKQFDLARDEPKRRSQRLVEIPKEAADSQQRLRHATDELAKLGAEDSGDLVASARRSALQMKELACRATLQSLDREQRLYQQGGDLLKLKRDYYSRYIPYKQRRLDQLRQIVNNRRESDAQQQAQLAAAEAEKAQEAERLAAANSKKAPPKILGDLANDNKLLAERRAEIAAEITLIANRKKAADDEWQLVARQYKRAQEQDAVDELSSLNGILLREQRLKLPNVRELRREQASLEAAIAEVLLENYSLNDQLSALGNIPALADELAAASGDLSDDTRAQIRQRLEAKREILEALVDSCEKYGGDLSALLTIELQLLSTAERYSEFIAERVLWIPSCSPLSRTDWRPAIGAVAWSLDPLSWRDAGTAVLQAAVRRPGQFGLYAIGIVALLAVQRSARRRLQELGEEAEKRNCSRLRPTVDALGLTVVLALPWPALLWFLGWTMDSLASSEFVRSLSAAARFSAVCLLLIELTRHLCRCGGLADAHFDWSGACLNHLRRNIRWLAIAGLPLVLWLVGLEVQQQQPMATSSLWSSSLGRILFILAMLLLSAVLQRTLMTSGNPFRQIVLVGGAWLKPLQIAWRPAVVLLPTALAMLAAAGYYFTAQQSAIRILQTVAMLLAMLTLGGLTRRWLLVNRRRLTREQAKQRRAALAAAAVESDSEAPPIPETAEETVDLAALSDQTQKLVRTFLAVTTIVGLGLIWNEILPALAYPAEKVIPGAEFLTWGQLAAFLIVLAVTYLAVRDVPALLELVILQHLPLDGGSRYAAAMLCRYVLAAIGLIAACNAVELKWGSVQWLVAAMSVGLGFGLQEIFANFVSGVIILFERPIRVGDIVTLGDTSGVVNRIRMRATTIVDWDRKEYVVPNKDLVTERLLNWTLSDHINRVTVLVGVAYGSDTDQACQLLLEAAHEQPHVLADPPPIAIFDGFGDSALNLKLLCYLPNLENRTATIHQLHTTIDRKFRAAGIEIPFPQREMRVHFSHDVQQISPDETLRILTRGAG